MRRIILLGGSLVGASFALAACGSTPAPPPPAPPSAPAAAAPETPPPPPAEPEISVYGYAAPDVGDWHIAFHSWQPVTVFELNGHYYPHSVPGARSVQVYHYKDTYFTPPRDKGFADKRLDVKIRPNDADYARARPRPHP